MNKEKYYVFTSSTPFFIICIVAGKFKFKKDALEFIKKRPNCRQRTVFGKKVFVSYDCKHCKSNPSYYAVVWGEKNAKGNNNYWNRRRS